MQSAPPPLPANFFSLPIEVAWKVFERLSDTDLETLSRVSPRMDELVAAFRDHRHNVFMARHEELFQMYG